MADLQFTPKKDEELVNLLKEGEGVFEVVKAERKLSKTLNPMIELLLKCWDCDGNQGNIYEYLMLTENVFSHRKIKHFCYSSGLRAKYESGQLNAVDCMNRTGKLLIGVQTDKTGKYPPKNNVYDFLKNEEVDKVNGAHPDLNDDIAF